MRCLAPAPARRAQRRYYLTRTQNCLLLSVLLLLLCTIKLIVRHSAALEQQHQHQQATPGGTQASNATLSDAPPPARLDCPPGEQRHFSYESSTRVWGASNQLVQLKAELRVKCMESPTNGTLKYLAEIVSLVPLFSSGSGSLPDQSKAGAAKPPWLNSSAARDDIWADDTSVRAEPLLEEVGEVAQRMKRSVSGWFNKTWLNVKDFFVNLFSSSERSAVSREQAIRESGLDIANQCKSKGKGSRTPGGLPMDDSVFDDLQPEYYVAASSLEGSPGHAAGFEFGGGGATVTPPAGVDDPDELISFFDDPKPARAKRAAPMRADEDNLSRQIRLPFVFVQSRSGKISEIRFSADELDLSVKNFKRHVCDLFATNLDTSKQTQNEVSPIGRHQTRYTLNAAANSMDGMKQSLIKAANRADDEQAARQLIRALASLGGPANGSASGPLDDEQSRDPVGGSQGDQRIAVMRTINATSQLQPGAGGGSGLVRMSTAMLTSDIDQLQVNVNQVQQIANGRLTGTAGQLSMALLRSSSATSDHHSNNNFDDLKLDDEADAGGADSVDELVGAGSARRHRKRARRSNGAAREDLQVEDMAELLQVSTSFSLRLVPIGRKPDGTVDQAALYASGGGGDGDGELQTLRSNRIRRAVNETNRLPLVERPPRDSVALQRLLQEWRKLEARLQLSSASLITELAGPGESELQRLELMRDQVRLRLNEERLRNRLRRQFGARQMALTESAARAQPVVAPDAAAAAAGNELGLSLTQLVLGNGVTTRAKGSVYQTLEEIIELEQSLAAEAPAGEQRAISRLMRDTVRMDKLAEHCRRSVATLDQVGELAAGSKRARKAASQRGDGSPAAASSSRSSKLSVGELELRHPFGVDDPGQQAAEIRSRSVGAADGSNLERWRLKFGQCRQMLQLMLKLADRRAADLTLELVDECNQRLAAAARNEELGYGPAGRYYRHVRQQLIELLAHHSRPSEQLLDRLLTRLNYSKLAPAGSDGKPAAASRAGAQARKPPPPPQPGAHLEPPEFVYVAPTSSSSQARRFNGSVLREEDDYNNNDAAGLLAATLTQLAAKRSVSQAKRVKVAERLLAALKGTSCSLFEGPDLDVLESLANFQEPLDEMVGRVLQLARKCARSDQYVAACLHALAGQTHSAPVQRYLADQLASPDVSCSVKSEIVSVLIGVQLANDLKLLAPPAASNASTAARWPNQGLNQVDATLLELVAPDKPAPDEQTRRRRALDRRCLRQLVVHYLSRKRHTNYSNPTSRLDAGQTSTPTPTSAGGRPLVMRPLRRAKRAVVNENNFWDEAECKRWTVPISGAAVNASRSNATTAELADELDDNSIMNAILEHQHQQSRALNATGIGRAARRRNQKLVVERELVEPSAGNATSGSPADADLAAPASFAQLRKRHKCSASKSFGPRGARATLRTEVVNELVGPRDENKFLARFRLATNFLGQQVDVGRMYLWHQRRVTRAHANILGRSIWDAAHQCRDAPPHRLLYMPLFDFQLWLVKVSVGLRLSAEMGFFSDCKELDGGPGAATAATATAARQLEREPRPADELALFPRVALRAAGEASAKFVVARAGMSLASNYAYQGDIRVSRQPESCMSVYSAHQPMNVTFSSWFQLWDGDCHFWGSRNRAEPQATKWRLGARKPIAWLQDECLVDRLRVSQPAGEQGRQ